MSKSIQFERLSKTDEVRSSLKRKSVQGALFMAVSQGVELLFRVGSTLILARLLVPEHFGLLGMVAAITGIAEQFSSLGLSTATVQVPKITHQQCSNLFWINLAAGVLFALAVCALAPAIAWFYQDERLVLITLVIALNFVLRGIAVQHEALLNRQMKQPQIAVNEFIASFASTVLAVALAFGGYGYWALVWREVARAALTVAGTLYLCPWIPGRPSREGKIGGLIRFGRNMALRQLLIALISRLDSLLVGKFSGPVSLGYYRQAYGLIMGPVEQLNSPIFSVSQPGLSVLQNDAGRYRRYYERILFVVSLTTIPLGLFTVVYAEEIVRVMLGEKWMECVVFLQIFGLAAAIRPSVATSGSVLVTCGRSDKFLVGAVAHSVVLGIAMWIGIKWGAQGIAIAHIGTTLVLLVPNLLYSFAGTPVTMAGFFKAVAKPAVAGAAMAAVLYLQRGAFPMESSFLSLIMGCGTAAFVYIGTLVLLPDGWKEIRALAMDAAGVLAQRKAAPGEVPDTP